jgi:hypothetical protein
MKYFFYIIIASLSLQTECVCAGPAVRNPVHADSMRVQSRTFHDEQVQNFREDSDFQYIVPRKESVTWLDTVLRWIVEHILRALSFATNTGVGNILFYGICLAVVLYAVIKLFNIDARELFYTTRKTSSTPFVVEEENIHEIDFEKLIQEAIKSKNFREGVRLLFLYALKKSSDNGLIAWKPGKTNDDYLLELRNHAVHSFLQELRLYFDYAWYGHFEVNEGTFDGIQKVFQDFNKRLS